MNTVVLVEGESDRIALETLAARLGRDLGAEEVEVIPMGGATNVATFLGRYGDEVRVLGLCDAAEVRVFDRAGVAPSNCFVCVEDLEDELIRALGTKAALDVVAAEGALRSFRTMQQQPAQRDRPIDAQLRRFIGSHSGNKARYARLFVEALDLTRTPPPLARLLRELEAAAGGRA